jgi:hypothetical protein
VWQSDGLARLQAAAALKGGECLLAEYQGANQRYRFRCSRNHEWDSRAPHVLAGTRCKLCLAMSRRLTIEEAQRIAAELGGRCLSTVYVGCQEKLRWLAIKAIAGTAHSAVSVQAGGARLVAI